MHSNTLSNTMRISPRAQCVHAHQAGADPAPVPAIVSGKIDDLPGCTIGRDGKHALDIGQLGHQPIGSCGFRLRTREVPCAVLAWHKSAVKPALEHCRIAQGGVSVYATHEAPVRN